MWDNHGCCNGKKRTIDPSKNHDSSQIETSINSKNKIK